MTNPIQSVDELAAANPALGKEFDEVVSRYFEYLNAARYQDTAQLFAANGVLYPPFETAIEGPEAIAYYLETEATGMALTPLQSTTELLASGDVQQQINGKVETTLFTVNVSWTFVLSPAAEILSVKVKLLAGLPELLNLKNDSSKKNESSENLSS